MRRYAFIVPGFGETSDQPEYQKIGGYFKDSNIEPVFIDITWNRKVMTDYVAEILDKKDMQPYVILGFSFGALASFIAATTMEPEYLVLCSLSPFFHEDLLGKLTWRKTWAGKKRLADLQKFIFSELAIKVKSRTFILVGSEEIQSVRASSKRAADNIKSSELTIVPGAKHDIGSLEYQKTVKEVIAKLR